jgi:hypothetical protein
MRSGLTAEFTGGGGLGDRPKVFVRPVRCGVGLFNSASDPSLRDRPPASGNELHWSGLAAKVLANRSFGR